MALREMALRHTAERVDEQMQVYRQDKAVAEIGPRANGSWCVSALVLWRRG